MASEDSAFLILHGWENFRPEGHWQYELARDLRALGRRVEYPQLPDASRPTVAGWASAVGRALGELAAEGRTVAVVCHSLSALLWLGANPDTTAVDRVLLVAPPSPGFVSGIDAIAAFGALPLRALAAGAPSTLIVASDDDPYCPEGAEAAFGGPLGIPVIVIPGGGHLELTAGYGHWPALTAWCLDSEGEIVGRDAAAEPVAHRTRSVRQH
ncbi:RBBP9/YdeN family alpha/beta hydrolase [Diaminobutyricibacter sp. McL0608]|uniref:RBBP9/YdeN family alpha/beta hydrolase n=1 Tax=Leifsonia sp. McL0608 TaxID=3143537 RepID=UPI0031F32131